MDLPPTNFRYRPGAEHSLAQQEVCNSSLPVYTSKTAVITSLANASMIAEGLWKMKSATKTIYRDTIYGPLQVQSTYTVQCGGDLKKLPAKCRCLYREIVALCPLVPTSLNKNGIYQPAVFTIYEQQLMVGLTAKLRIGCPFTPIPESSGRK